MVNVAVLTTWRVQASFPQHQSPAFARLPLLTAVQETSPARLCFYFQLRRRQILAHESEREDVLRGKRRRLRESRDGGGLYKGDVPVVPLEGLEVVPDWLIWLSGAAHWSSLYEGSGSVYLCLHAADTKDHMQANDNAVFALLKTPTRLKLV